MGILYDRYMEVRNMSEKKKPEERVIITEDATFATFGVEMPMVKVNEAKKSQK